ncbi:MAG: hypothetical protein WDO71_02815 [Bacteroidota bacterium]
MKRRIRRIANFFAFNLLFFALYLNFIHKDNAASGIPDQKVQATAAVSNTVPVSQPEKYLEPKAGISSSASTTGVNSTANLSIN